jgi:hypothetical protein
MHAGWVHEHGQDEPLHVDHEVALASGDAFATVIAPLATCLAGARGLAVDDGPVRIAVPSGQLARRSAQNVIDVPPDATLARRLNWSYTLRQGGNSCGSSRQGTPPRSP